MAALFGSKKKKAEQVKEVTPLLPVASRALLSGVLYQPRITEKATQTAVSGVYVFEIASEANRYDVKKAVEDQYKILPEKVRIVHIRSKERFVRGKWGKTAAKKKAYVYLPKGKTIEIV